MAGSLKRQNPDKPEDVVLIRALRDSNLPKFLVDDAALFQVSICSERCWGLTMRYRKVMQLLLVYRLFSKISSQE